MILKRQKWRDIMNGKKDYQEYIRELGRKIKTYRIMKEMSQQDLEDKTGVSKRSISRLEQGKSVQVAEGFWTYSHENMIIVAPPLIITEDEIVENMKIMDKVLTEVDKWI